MSAHCRVAAALAAALLFGACGPAESETPATADCGPRSGEVGRYVAVPPGEFLKGRLPLYPEEGPTVLLHVSGFSMQRHEVTNAQFAEFVDATGYVTDAERSMAAGGPGAGSAVFESQGAEADRGWRLVSGATWRAPGGPDTSLDGLEQHPVVHVSLRDARAYAAWAGGRLPTEEEWEYAASLGLEDPGAPASGAYDGAGRPVANTWQGPFPHSSGMKDGFHGAAPVGCFPPNSLGLYDLIGNVWEWTDTAFDDETQTHAIKGGSFLCSENGCRRYRPAARQPQDIDFSSNHIGFRVVRDAGHDR